MAATDVVSENFSELYWKPKYGMEFDSDESAYDFYNAYGSKVGFSIRKETFGKNKRTDRKKNKFFVYHFVESHNHPLVMEECTHMLSSQRRISSSQAMEVDLADGFGISLKSTYELMVKQVGGRKSLGYT
ncbi:hypothetical protein WN944_006548 [Citrus x changshan-huyou]|uniref:Protein FAR1-RELATED SEQUENCE n=1 Tax=Citrus x changshan-huyou TaxID=2935761 RepID=A0AAP0MQU1_9ROSI